MPTTPTSIPNHTSPCRSKQALKALLVITCAGCLLSLFAMNTDEAGYTTARQRGAAAWNKHATDTAAGLLRTGYLVLRMGRGADSRLLAQINRKDKSFSHCGIVLVEHGYPFVYHSIGGEDNPDERLRRDSACFFFSAQHNSSVGIVRYDMDALQLQRLGEVVRQFYSARPKFDLQFDMATDDKLYCSEFAYKAITRATGDTAYLTVTSAIGHTFAGVDDLYMNRHASRIWQVSYR